MSLRARNISVRKGKHLVLDNISISLDKGSICSVIGPNGAGKSTLISALSGEQTPEIGEIYLENSLMRDLSAEQMAQTRSVMYQSNNVVFDFSVEEILMMGWVRDAPGSSPLANEVVCKLATLCTISPLLKRSFLTLSGGEKQRVQFCRALVQVWLPPTELQPKYLLLDEPTSHLDVSHELEVMNILKQIGAGETGILIALHDLNLASYFSDKIYLLSEGKVFASGPPSEVVRSDILSEVYESSISVEERKGKLHVYTH
jgi:iron complex transport system ATP-binding protein